MIPYRAGNARQRVTLYDVPATTQDDYGQVAQAPTVIGTYWAEVLPLRGRRLTQIRTTWPMATHTVHLRWLGSAIPVSAANPAGHILPRMYLVLSDGSRLDITFANNVEKRNRYWELTCEEKVTT